MGYWESLDEEYREWQKQLPWYRRDVFIYLAFALTIAFFTFQFIHTLKAAGRWLLSWF
jgi:hypothetical protein